MPGKQLNTLRQFHLLIVREPTGFSWQVRYGRIASVVEGSSEVYATQAEAEARGVTALAHYRLVAAKDATTSTEPDKI